MRGCSDIHAFSHARETACLTAPYGSFCPCPLAMTPEKRFSPASATCIISASFRNEAIEFLDAFSASLIQDSAARTFPEIVALAFWLRRSNVAAMCDRFLRTLSPGEVTQPLGLVFHVAPSNVDTIFAYSWALSLLAGNGNIVRISQSPSQQLDVLLGVLARLAGDQRWSGVWRHNAVVTYAHDDSVSAAISRVAIARVLWGGDQTVSHLRGLPSPPGSRDVGFIDKTSASVISASHYLATTEQGRQRVAEAFMNDAYQFDQLACSSPHIVFFCGPDDDLEQASSLFWKTLSSSLDAVRATRLPVNHAIDKMVAAYELLVAAADARWTVHDSLDRLSVVRLPLASLAMAQRRIGGGFFIECLTEQLADLATVASRSVQTLGYWGYSAEQMLSAAPTLTLHGIDRIVPVGKALDFAPVWDGHVLLSALTRRVSVH